VTSPSTIAEQPPAAWNSAPVPAPPVQAPDPRAGRALTIAIAGFPVFWALGLGEFVWIVIAPPMLYRLWTRPNPIRVPPFFGLWLAYLVWAIAGAGMIGSHLPGTLATSGGFIGWGVRVANLLAATVVLLYLGNLTEAEMPTRKVIRLLAYFFSVVVLGGLLGTFFGSFNFTSPLEMVLPHGLRSTYYVRQLVHPGFAQLQDILGTAEPTPRPKAPFAYTNNWGNNVALLLIWFVVAGWIRGSRKSKVYTALTLVAAAIPIIYSLNRGVWIGLGISLLFLALQLALRGKFGLIAGIATIGALAAVLFTVTPLKSLVNARLNHGQSNSIRYNLNSAAFDAAVRSPIIGWGTTRSVLGSPESIAIGKTSSCPTCGNAPIGSTGELWNTLIANGFVGVLLFYGFIVLVGFRYRRDRTPEGVAARLILYLAPFYAVFYSAVPNALVITFISLALLWRANQPAPVPAPALDATHAQEPPNAPAVIVLP
jgi:hypothetical protein